jgi:putative oxidoreductase
LRAANRGNLKLETVMESDRHDIATSIGLLILRLGIGGYMLSHGVGKLDLLLAGQFEAIGDPIGLGSTLSLVLLVLAEFLCALLVMVGLATRFAAAPIVFAMAVAAFVTHGGDPWTMEGTVRVSATGEVSLGFSKQPALMFLIPFLALVFTGAGRFSFDALIRPRLRPRAKHETVEEAFPVNTHEERK